MNTPGTSGFMGQINMYSDAVKGLTESVFEFRYEVHGKPGVLVDDKDMLFKMAFVDFDEDRRQSVTETFCVDLDQLDIDSSDVSDWDKVQHPSGEPRFFIPGFPRFGGGNGNDLDVKILNTTCNGGSGKNLLICFGPQNPQQCCDGNFSAKHPTRRSPHKRNKSCNGEPFA